MCFIITFSLVVSPCLVKSGKGNSIDSLHELLTSDSEGSCMGVGSPRDVQSPVFHDRAEVGIPLLHHHMHSLQNRRNLCVDVLSAVDCVVLLVIGLVKLWVTIWKSLCRMRGSSVRGSRHHPASQTPWKTSPKLPQALLQKASPRPFPGKRCNDPGFREKCLSFSLAGLLSF